jgi:hypothetical protein
MKLRVLLLGIVLLGVLTACSGAAPQLRDPNFLKDQSLVSGEPCDAPCWQGITPGETKWNDAVTAVEDNPIFANMQADTEAPEPSRALNFDAKDGSRCCRIYSLDGVTVNSMFALVSPDMRLTQVIEKYGDPSYFFVEEVSGDQALVSLIYPDIPLIVYVFSAGLAEGEITGTSEIVGTLYLTSTDMTEAIRGSALYEWAGYGKLSDLADGNYEVTPVPTEETNAESTPNAEATAETTAQSNN